MRAGYCWIVLAIAQAIFAVGMNTPQDSSAIEETEQETPDSNTTAQLDRIVVTATRTSRRASQTPASVSVIPVERIESAPARNMDDLLQYETGVQVKRSVGMGEGVPSDIIIRGIPGGLAATRTLILVDGIPTNASGTPFLILNEIPLDAIQRIEIVRGPYSSLYGANAFGGVINLITKTGYGSPTVNVSGETTFPFSLARTALQENSPGGMDLLRAGSDRSLWHGGVQGGGSVGPFDFMLSGGARSIGNYLLSDTAIIRRGTEIENIAAKNYNYRDYRLFGKLGFQATERIRTKLHMRYFNSDLGFGMTRGTEQPSEVRTKGEKILVGPFVHADISDRVGLVVGGFYGRIYGQYLSEGLDLVDNRQIKVPSIWDALSSNWQVEGRSTIRIGEMQVISAGFDHLWNDIDFGATLNQQSREPLDNSHPADEGIRNLGVSIQDEINVGPVKVVPAIRYDYHSDFGDAWSPKLGVLYRAFDDLSLRFSTGRAFRAPSLSELYLPEMQIREGFYLKPNPALNPEYVWAWECGFSYLFLKNIKFQTDIYYNSMRDLISPTLSATLDGVTHGTIDSAYSKGIENSVEWRFLEWLGGFLNVVIQETRDRPHNVALDYIPSLKTSAGITMRRTFRRSVLSGSINESYVGKRGYLDWQSPVDSTWEIILYPYQSIRPPFIELEPYWLTDMEFRYAFGTRYWIALSAQNLFNAKMELSGGTLAPGRFVVLRAGVMLGKIAADS